MIQLRPEAIFYIQATAATGMGHLTRSAALIGALDERGVGSRCALRLDEQGRELAYRKGLTGRETDLQSARLAARRIVIDAVNIPDVDAQNMVPSRQRILISPVCNRAEIATHALLRFAPVDLIDSLAADCFLNCDYRFAYATAAALPARDLQLDCQLVVGICLSGGAAQPEIGALVRAALSTPGVKALYVIHPESPTRNGSDRRVFHRTFCDDPWEFLAHINVFVGGDGVMVGEAVAQGLPCLSIARPETPHKNRWLVDAGCIDVCFEDMAPSALSALLSDRGRLESMHSAALAQGAGPSANALVEAIEQLVKT